MRITACSKFPILRYARYASAGTLTSAGNNIATVVIDAQCIVNGSFTPVAALLGLLQNNGGPAPTHALLPASAAIDAGNPAGSTVRAGAILVTDQPGEPRLVRSACDLGAFERGNPVFKDGFES